jgi:hypothetical protein
MAVTVTYLYPATVNPPGTTPPTPTPIAGQPANLVVATILATAATDVSAVVTHDFNLNQSDISNGFPELDFVPQTSEVTQPWEISEGRNHSVIGLGGVGLWKVFVNRPHSISGGGSEIR